MEHLWIVLGLLLFALLTGAWLGLYLRVHMRAKPRPRCTVIPIDSSPRYKHPVSASRAR